MQDDRNSPVGFRPWPINLLVKLIYPVMVTHVIQDAQKVLCMYCAVHLVLRCAARHRSGGCGGSAARASDAVQPVYRLQDCDAAGASSDSAMMTGRLQLLASF